MESDVKVGNVYVGSVTGEKFIVFSIETHHATAPLEVVFFCKKSSEKIRETWNLVQWLIKSGGLIKV